MESRKGLSLGLGNLTMKYWHLKKEKSGIGTSRSPDVPA